MINQEAKEFIKIILTGVGIILFWRGVWAAADAYIFPDNLELSIAFCTIVGLAIIIVMRYKNF